MIYVVYLHFHEYSHAYSFGHYDEVMQFITAAKVIIGLEWLEVTNDEHDESYYVWHAI